MVVAAAMAAALTEDRAAAATAAAATVAAVEQEKFCQRLHSLPPFLAPSLSALASLACSWSGRTVPPLST